MDTINIMNAAIAITISISREQDVIVVRLEDDAGALPVGDVKTERAPGIGVRNLRERLAGLYGERASFNLIQLAPAGVRAEMRLPCR